MKRKSVSGVGHNLLQKLNCCCCISKSDKKVETKGLFCKDCVVV